MTKTTVQRPVEWVSQYFPKSPTDRQLQEWRNIWWRVAVIKNIPPTDPMFEYMLAMGMPLVDKVLFHQPLGLTNSYLMFVFPERWMTTPEEQLFIPMLRSHPEVASAKMTIIDIVTKSPLIVGNFLIDDVRSVFRPDKEDTRSRRIRDAEKRAEEAKGKKHD